jgi:hypothetical protein
MPDYEIIRRKRRYLRLLLFAIFVAALLFRLWGMGFGLPQQVHIDEPNLVERAVNIGLDDNFSMSYFLWPNFMIYLLHFEFIAVAHITCLLGLFHKPDDFLVTYHVDPSIFLWIGRLTTTIFCLGGMACLYQLGKKIAGTAAGMAAVLIMAFNFLFITHSRYITPDIPAACLMIYVWLCLIDYTDSGRLRMLYSAAFVGGVAVSTKYNAALMLVPVVLTALSRVQQWPGGDVPKIARRLFVYTPVCIALFVLGFILFTPFSVLDSREFIKQISFQANLQYWGHIGMEAKGSPLFEIVKYFYSPYGIALVAFAILGIPSFGRPLRRALILLSFPVLYLIAVSGWVVWSERYMFYFLPMIFLAAGMGISSIAGLLTPNKKEITALLIALAVSAPCIYQGIQSAIIMNRTHTVVAAEQWIEENIPHGSIMFIEQGGPEPYSISTVKEYKLDVYPVYAYAQPELTWNVETLKYTPIEKLRMLQPTPEYIVSTGYTLDRYFDPETRKKYPELVKPWIEYSEFIEANCVLLAEFNPGKQYSGWWVKIYRLPPGALENYE